MRTAVDTKDFLIGLIDREGSTKEKMEDIKLVLETLMLTKGLWVELNYAYKGAELADRCFNRVAEMLMECNHWKTIKALEELREGCRKVENGFVEIHNDTFYK